MEIKRDSYLEQLISYRFDGLVKVITGIRRCGKSYLLKNIYRDYLIENGVKDEYYLFVDEIQMSDEVANPYNPDGKKITFYDALNDLRGLSNLDVYVTGSNSKMLSSDILTEFRGRSDEIRVHPLSFAEYYSAVGVVYARTLSEKGSSVRTPREIDFVINSGGKRTYIQSAYAMPTDEKAEVELRPFTLTGDSFPKIVVRKDIGKRWYDDNGILNINVIDFLLDKELI